MSDNPNPQPENGKDETIPEPVSPEVPIESKAPETAPEPAPEPTPIPTEEIPPPAAVTPVGNGRRGPRANRANGAPRRGRGGKASHAKGSSFERRVGRDLSLWLTSGERNNLFSRNVLSGGQFTNALGRGKSGKELNLPGDLAAAHPEAFEFLKHFTVEVKHNNLLMLGTYLLDDKHKSFIEQVLIKVDEQSNHADLHWMFIGKQDRRPAFVLFDGFVGDKIISLDTSLVYHRLFNDSVFLVRFADFLNEVDADRFLALFAPPIKTFIARRVLPPAPMMQRRALPAR